MKRAPSVQNQFEEGGYAESLRPLLKASPSSSQLHDENPVEIPTSIQSESHEDNALQQIPINHSLPNFDMTSMVTSDAQRYWMQTQQNAQFPPQYNPFLLQQDWMTAAAYQPQHLNSHQLLVPQTDLNHENSLVNSAGQMSFYNFNPHPTPSHMLMPSGLPVSLLYFVFNVFSININMQIYSKSISGCEIRPRPA